MSSKRITLIAALLVSLAIPVQAAKRRSVNAPGGNAQKCHVFGLVTAGTVATYLTNAQGGDVNFEITYISETPTQLKTKQKVQTAQGNADVETVIDGEVVGNLRGIKHIKVTGKTVVPVLGTLTTETELDFVPSLISGPAEGWCTGAKWTVSPVTETITVRSPGGNFTNTVTTVASEGEVLAVGEMLSVPAGDFRTVKYRGVIIAGDNPQPAITWVSMERNVVVKQDTLDAAGNVTSVTRLMKLQ